MPIDVFCECGHLNEVDETLAGGIVNCAGCGRAVEVEGLRDPLWRTIQAGAVIAWAGATAWTYAEAGAVYAAAVAVGLAITILLLSRVF